MKKLTNFISFFAIVLIINGQWTIVNGQTITQQKGLTYQAVARNASGNIIANQNISVRFSLITGSASGPVYYQETQSLTTNSLGLFNATVFVGASLNTTGTFDPTKWQTIAALGAFMKVEMDITGGSAYVDMGTTQLLSVPFALYAESSGVTPGSVTYIGTWDADNNSPDLALSAPVKGYYYVVTVAGTTSLTGIDDWNVGDWAVFNGTDWNKIAGPTPGAVTFKGTWDAITNTPPLSNGAGTKGFYYVVSNSGSTSLNGITDWGTGDWVIYNGTAWGKVDNTDAVSDGENISGSGAGVFKVKSNTLLQFKKLTNSDGSAVVQDNPNTIDIGVQFDDAGTSASRTWSAFKINSELNSKEPIITGTGSINDFWSGAKTFRNLGTDVRALPLTGLSLATNQVINASSTVIQAFGYLQKQISDNLSSITTTKVDRAGDTMTGDLILNADPSSALGAATKQYVDATATGLGIANKADKVVGATNGHFAGLDASGNLTDSGKNPSSFLPSSTTATNIPFTPSGNITSANVQDAVEEVSSDFANLIDSFLNLTDDNLTVYTDKHFGINDTTSPSPLGIKGETGQDDQMISFTSNDESQKWNINLNPTGNDVDGFSIDDITTGTSSSRFFIDHVSQGNIGIGTVQPNQKLHVSGANDGGNVSIMVENLESGTNGGWLMSAIEDNAVAERMKTFAIHEKSGSSLAERITVLSGGNVGINETLPYAKLHISRDPLDPQSAINLAENTGVLVLGPIDDKNLGMDAHQIQARTGEYIGTSLSFTATTLGLQPYGGGVTINANSSLGSEKAIITSDAKLGLGIITPAEKIDIDGAIKIGTTITNNEGTLRWSGSDFEGYDGSGWKSFTNTFWSGTLTLDGDPAITYNVANPKVGIGVAQPEAALDVKESGSSTLGRTAFVIRIDEANTDATAPHNRIGMKVTNSGQWSSNALSKDIGIYVSNVTGQSANESNIAAVLNGNVVIGDVTSSAIIGTNGRKVLAFQDGDIPTQAIGGAGVSNGGIQVYSAPNSLGTSIFNVMTGDGSVIKLFRSTAITTPDNSSLGSSYGTTEQLIISNMRDRINALEAKLQAFGLLD